MNRAARACDDDEAFVVVELSPGPDTTLCDPPEQLPEARPVRGFSLYAGRHVRRSS